MNRFAAYCVIVLSTVLGGGSLLLFGAFLITGPFTIIHFDASESQVLIWDGFLSISFLAIAGFIWGVHALRTFDPFGRIPIMTHLRGKQLRPPDFVMRGPYLWVRHPLYFFMLVLIWSIPNVTSDRLLFNVLWTFWIVLGSYLEEKDVLAEFGERYRDYQKTVPMLLPWRGPIGRGLRSP